MIRELFKPGRAPDWTREGRDWPLRAHSRFVRSSAIQWHVQSLGRGEPVVLLHGLGASTHSWRDVAPLLAEHFTVWMADLPGHGFTEAPAGSRMTLTGTATAVAELLEGLDVRPVLAVGHSAGAAILCQMALMKRLNLRGIISVNGALRPFQGALAPLFQGAARLMSSSPLAANWVAQQTRDRRKVEALVEGTGSRLDARGLDLYHRLVRCPGHNAAALQMMAGWDLSALDSQLDRLECPLLLVAGARDTAVAPAHALALAGRHSRLTVRVMPDVGHLSHEERPAETVAVLLEEARRLGSLPSHRASSD